ncbi:MAG: endonuclease [Flavobacteriaceae bacterium]|nr:endonuclease [Flavobacteriaceae bacterium]
MKKLNFFDKLIYILNSIFAFILILSYLIPKIKPSILSSLSLISLLIPIIFVVNMLFVVYWIVKLKRQFLLSFIILLLGLNYVKSFINFSNNSEYVGGEKISIMSYNVRMFNIYSWIKKTGVKDSIADFINKTNPDIVSIQEYNNVENFNLIDHPFKYMSLSGENIKYGQAIFSKFPIINSGEIKFRKSTNSAIFSDIKVGYDTIRLFNIHLQSFKLKSDIDISSINNDSSRLINSFSDTFRIQQDQAEIVMQEINRSPYKVVVSGDFNNTAFSYVYNLIKSDLKDSFFEKGNGLGQTYSFNSIPLRIDFILVDKSFKVNNFKTFKFAYSDHFPIFSEFSVN